VFFQSRSGEIVRGCCHAREGPWRWVNPITRVFLVSIGICRPGFNVRLERTWQHSPKKVTQSSPQTVDHSPSTLPNETTPGGSDHATIHPHHMQGKETHP
jgi:hypothetical protein